MTLSAHTTTTRCTEAEVLAVPEPEWTKTWHPVSHAKVLESLGNSVGKLGIKVNTRQYSLNGKGTQMFGVWGLDLGSKEIGYSLGFRNAIDRSMTLGVCDGTNVFVCDNLMFSGDFIMFRKHTSGLDYEEVQELSDNAVERAVIQMEKLEQWQQSLHEIEVPEPDFKQLAYDMIMAYVFSPAKLLRYVDAVQEEIKLEKGRTLYTVHGGATRLLREASLHRVSDATKKLNGLCDDYMALKAA